MTEHSLQLIRVGLSGPVPKIRHPLGRLDAARMAKHVSLFRPSEAQIDEIVDRARLSIPAMTSNDVVHRVLEHNPDCLWGISTRRQPASAASAQSGFIAMLPLTRAGLEQLAANILN